LWDDLGGGWAAPIQLRPRTLAGYQRAIPAHLTAWAFALMKGTGVSYWKIEIISVDMGQKIFN
jgi:hypothetical protein